MHYFIEHYTYKRKWKRVPKDLGYRSLVVALHNMKGRAIINRDLDVVYRIVDQKGLAVTPPICYRDKDYFNALLRS